MSRLWKYRLVWKPVSRATLPHPGYALHRTLKSVSDHAVVLLAMGIRDAELEEWRNGDWWNLNEPQRRRR